MFLQLLTKRVMSKYQPKSLYNQSVYIGVKDPALITAAITYIHNRQTSSYSATCEFSFPFGSIM